MRRPSRDVSKETHVRCLLPEKPEASRRERRQYAGVGGAMSCPVCSGTGWIPPEMTEEHPSQSACMRCAAPKRDMPAWDTFAAAALTGIIAGDASGDSADVCVQWAATMADAMMAERAKR